MTPNTPNAISITQIEVAHSPHATRISARVNSRELYFELGEKMEVGDVASAMLAFCIYPAMRLGLPLLLDERFEASPKLVANLRQFQDIFAFWYPALHRVPVEARVRKEHSPASGGIASMFSGGVDSSYTYLSEEDLLTSIVFVGGLDIAPTETDRYRQSLSRYSAFATSRGKRLVSMWTNIKGFWPEVQMSPHHGQVLAGIGIMMGFQRTYIPASHTYAELDAWGSHPLTDPLFSTEATATIHHGVHPRRQKLRAVALDKECLDMLRVCNSSDEYNCGTCEKCLRTMVALHLLGATSRSLPRLESLRSIRQLRLHSDTKLNFWRDNLLFAREAGDREVAAAIVPVLRGYETRRALRRLREAFRRSGSNGSL